MAYPQLRASIPTGTSINFNSDRTCTFPTGLTAGDLMLLFVGTFDVSEDGLGAPSGWTTVESYTNDGKLQYSVYKKIASSGDVSAGSVTLTPNGTIEKFVYATFAITGAASGLEISVHDLVDVSGTTQTTVSVTQALTPAVNESLILSSFLLSDNNLSGVLTGSSFTLSPTTSLTERVDIGLRDGLSDGCSLLIATGEYAGTTVITNQSVIVSESINGFQYGVVVLVNAPQNATASNALFQTTPEYFSPLTASTQEPNNDFQEISPEFFTQSAKVTQAAQWSNETKPTSAWTNPAK